MRIRKVGVRPSPDVFAAVMATGILSIAAQKQHYRPLSEPLIMLAAAGMTLLVVLVLVTGAAKRWDLKDPDVTVRLFTFVAACAVLDSGLDAVRAVVLPLGLAAFSCWLTLALLTTRNMAANSWTALRDRARGAWELASVGTSGTAIVAAEFARHPPLHWCSGVAVVLWVAGLCSYGLMTSLILWRAIAERQDGFEPDSWILMGGLAIATLTGDRICSQAAGWLGSTVATVTVLTWLAATLWIPALTYLVLRRIKRRPALLRFAGVWWAMVFPLGMYSVATAATAANGAAAAELGRSSLKSVSLVFFWIALVAWLVVVLAGLLRIRALAAATSKR
ncbi:tellurite resistance/C4-dicarboxylate transporter family protein [Mycobacterium vicinigordonae]|uniref:Tellurite resistance/C4-dicarboxylate transporter family protein n=1 Tax=Mycobacterium vicinigordonae TaxID=1719132 RepID=A0A7D6DX18_9MYCO|nr:tellurite resistance/C4-dicarboxylate transporter family protein [Mycobacterium vicinigordonae]QLL06924.1 tellurite resistance/C4-dicarboxylate transporter family protein [Mycobacterium vicinigordonae]